MSTGPGSADAPTPSSRALAVVEHWSLAVVGILTLLCAGLVGDGIAGPIYLLIFAFAAIPGLPLGFLLFGARHPGGWLAGTLFGYVLTALAIWIPLAFNVVSILAIAVAWVLVTGATWFAARSRPSPVVALAPWRASESCALAVALVLVLALATPPFARIGAPDARGDKVTRAYFTADFVWHTALAAELGKFTMPPRNPYLASQAIHYYWGYFLMPATVAQLAPAPLNDIQRCLKVNALLTGMLLVSATFLAAWAAVRRPWAVAAAVGLVLVAGSAEGSYEIYRLWGRGQPMAALRDINIDAITAWHFQGLRLDGLPRCLWYVPQHSMSYALGLIGLTVAAAIGSTGSLVAILLAGMALAGSTMLNPFVGGLFALAWGVSVGIDALRRPLPVITIARHLLAAVPVALALGWCFAAHMVDGAGDTLAFGFWGPPAYHTSTVLLLSLGPVLLPGVVGIIAPRSVPLNRVIPAFIVVALGLLVMHLVRLRVDTAWVPFRAGQMLLVTIPALIARAIVALWDAPRLRLPGVAVLALLFAVGVPTTAIDAYNAQDVDDLDVGPGFHWTLVLTPDEQRVLNWIRTSTPKSALVQMEPTARDRDLSPAGWGERWSLIPSFAERRMAAGLPISLMRVPEYLEKSLAVKTIYQTESAHEAWTIARRLHVSYLYVDSVDRDTYPGAAKFDTSPQFFTPVFTSGKVAVYQVK